MLAMVTARRPTYYVYQDGGVIFTDQLLLSNEERQARNRPAFNLITRRTMAGNFNSKTRAAQCTFGS